MQNNNQLDKVFKASQRNIPNAGKIGQEIISTLAKCYYCNIKMDKSNIRNHIHENHPNKPVIFGSVKVKKPVIKFIQSVDSERIVQNLNLKCESTLQDKPKYVDDITIEEFKSFLL